MVFNLMGREFSVPFLFLFCGIFEFIFEKCSENYVSLYLTTIPVISAVYQEILGKENILGKGETYTQRVIPSGLTEFLIYISPTPKVSDPDRRISDNVVLSGHQKDYYDMEIASDLSLFSVVFHPQGLMNFFDIPLNELYNQNVPLEYLGGR